MSAWFALAFPFAMMAWAYLALWIADTVDACVARHLEKKRKLPR